MSINGFDKEGFMRFLEQTFSGFTNSFLRDTVSNIVDYGLKHENISLDQLCYFLSDVVPEVDFSEVALFMDDSMLTHHSRELKKEAMAELEDPDPEVGSEFVQGSLDDLVASALRQQSTYGQGPVPQETLKSSFNFEDIFDNR